jgi:hypothetical protein
LNQRIVTACQNLKEKSKTTLDLGQLGSLLTETFDKTFDDESSTISKRVLTSVKDLENNVNLLLWLVEYYTSTQALRAGFYLEREKGDQVVPQNL